MTSLFNGIHCFSVATSIVFEQGFASGLDKIACLRYVMDELGSAIRHSDAPNFQAAPFMYLPDGTLQSAIRFELLLAVSTSVVLFLVSFFPLLSMCNM